MEIIDFLPGWDAAHDADFARIYEASFPAAERSETPELFDELRAGDVESLAGIVDGQLVGLAVWRPLEAAPGAFLEYLAIAPDARNGGLGATLYQAVIERLRADSEMRWLIWEVEPPYAAEEPERTIRVRRIGFYERQGARVLTAAPLYRVPRSDGDGLLPFILMASPLRDDRLPNPDELRALVAAILVEGYGLEPEDSLVRCVREDIVG